MNREAELHYYLKISPNMYGIYLFDTKNLKILYNQEIIIKEDLNFNNLKKFLDNNIYKIEKLTGKFVKNIFLILENKNILDVKIGIKKKNYNNFITRECLESSLADSKDLFRENYKDEKIMHMIINKYLINGQSYSSFEDHFKSDYLALEVQFKSISDRIINELENILENYQIKIIRYIDGNYIKSFCDKEEDLATVCHEILNGYNHNEVTLVPKNTKKLAFFEKFFQLFS